MDNQTAKSIDQSLKSIARSLQKIEKNTRPVMTVAEEYGNDEVAIAQIGKGPRHIPKGTAFHFGE